MRARLVVVVLVLFGVVAAGQAPAAASGRWRVKGATCAKRDPFTPEVRAEVARRWGGHHVTAEVYDTLTGCRWSLNPGVRVTTASAVKAEIFGALLLRAQRQHRGLTASELSRIHPMLEQSRNPPTSSLWSDLGGTSAMHAVDRQLGLASTIATSPWGLTSTTALDQVNLLRQLLLGEGGAFTPASVATANDLMDRVIPSQRWGVTAGMYPGSKALMKNGFFGSGCCGWRINTIGAVRRPEPNATKVIAVLSDGWGTMQQGIDAVHYVSWAVNRFGIMDGYSPFVGATAPPTS